MGYAQGAGHLFKPLSISDSQFLEIQPPRKKKKKEIGMMVCACLVTVQMLENLWAEQVW